MNQNTALREEIDDTMVQQLREIFKEEAYELLAELENALLELEKTPQDPSLVSRVFRALHTLKGSGGSCGLDDVAAFTHELETCFDRMRKGEIVVTHEIISLALTARDRIKDMLDAYYRGGTSDEARCREVLAAFRELHSADKKEKAQVHPLPAAEEKQPAPEPVSSIRVATEKLDTLVNLVGELVTIQARLSQTAALQGVPQFIAIAEEVERLTADLRDVTMTVRMLPISSLFGRFHRLVRDLAGELGKDVDLVVEGAETELDKNVIERLHDPLVHLIRNCIDHGIEAPDVREQSGKPRKGTVSLSAAHVGAQVEIRISDDGVGLDQERILAKAVDQGLLPAGVSFTAGEIFPCIFAPGFSTADEITNVSGRGVGLDVVKRVIDGLGGTIELNSERGSGMAFILKLPLTLAIIDGFLTESGQERYVFPLALVEECVELKRDQAERGGGNHLLTVRGAFVPYIRLREQFKVPGEPPAIEQVVIVRHEQGRVGIVVDQVKGGIQTVIKNLGSFLNRVEGVSGATILGDGSIALILDMPKLISMADRREARLCDSERAR